MNMTYTFNPPKSLAALVFFFSFLTSAPLFADEQRRPHFFSDATTTNPAKSPPKRIISLAPVVTETLYSLGVESSVVGVTRFCDRPLAAKRKPKVGGYIDVSLEKLLALKPDLVIAMPSSGQRQVLEQISAQGIPIYITFGDTLVEIRELILGIGTAVHQETKAQDLLNELNNGLNKAKNSSSLPKKRILLLVAASPLVAAGPSTFANDALTVLGLSNAAQKGPPWPVLSLESLAALQADLIVVASGPDDGKKVQDLFKNTRLPFTVLVPSKAILMRPGPSLHLDVMTLGSLIQTELTAKKDMQ